MLVSVLSVFGALGGYLVGSFFGGVGGLLAFAWRPPTVEEIKAEYGTVADEDPDAVDDSAGKALSANGADRAGDGVGSARTEE
jgi:hypothetical protein